MSLTQDRLEQVRMVRDSVAAVAPAGGDLRRIRALRFTTPGFDRETWKTMCDMGWPGLRVSEEDGGAGFGVSESSAVAEELGKSLVPEPLLPAALAARLLSGAALERQLSGEQLVLPAWQERAGAIEPGEATQWHDGTVSGRKMFIPMASGADAFVVVLADGLALVQADAPGVTLRCDATQDGGHYGTLTLDGAKAKRIAAPPGAVAEALDEATLATAAMLLGVMERAFELSLDYLRTRKQFGKPIGSFQSLQHRSADLKIQVALTRASVEAAAASLDAGVDARLRQAVVSRAKARAADAAMRITREAIQLHGGIGYTDEADVGLYLRKAMVLANQHGTAAAHRLRYAEMMPEEES